jgi:diguanylate cyclase (GGDEF)-like protein/PAS domain S-box-containing protein
VRGDTSIDPNGYPDFAIKPPGDRPEYFPVEYLEPMAGNEEALGLDAGGDAVRFASVERARDSGQLVASGRITITRGGTGYAGFVLRLPLYRNGMPQETVAQRRQALVGLITSSYRMNHLMQGVLSEPLLRQIRIRIYDVGYADSSAQFRPPTADNLLFDTSDLTTESAKKSLNLASDEDTRLTEMLTLDVGGRRWNLYSSAQREFVGTFNQWRPLIRLLGGITISLLLFGLTRSLATTGSRAIELADRITDDLRKSEAGLAAAQRMTQQLIEALPNPIFFKDTDGRYLGVNKAWEKFFGVSRQAFIGKTVHDLYPNNPEVAQRLHAMDQELWTRPGTQTYETSITTPDAQRHDAIYYKATFTHADGSVAGLIGTIVDITERKQAEAVRAQLAAIVENANDAIFSRSLDGTIQSWNAGAEKMLGYTAAEAIGKPIGFTLPPNRPPNLDRNNEKVLSGEVVARESDRMTKDGRVIDVLTSHSPIRDSAGKIVGAAIILQDITALKQAQAAVKESEERFRATFDQAAVGIAHFDLEHRYVKINRRYSEIVGYAPEELLGKEPGFLNHPDDVGMGTKQRGQLFSGAIDHYSQDKRYIRKDGKAIWVRRTESLARDAAGAPQYYIRVIEDITERKETDERYRATFDNAPVGIMHVDLERKIAHVNGKLCEILGYTQEELIGKPVEQVVHPDSLNTDRSHKFSEAMLAGKIQSDVSERAYLRKDGSTVCVNRTISLVRDAAGAPLYFVRIIEDITDRKDLERRFELTFNYAPVGILHSSFDRRILLANKRFLDMTGYNLEELQQMPPAAIIHPDDAGSNVELEQQLLDGKIDNFLSEKRYLSKHGRVIWTKRTTSVARSADGTPQYFIRVIDDVTETRLTEERYRAMFENAAVGITRVDLNGILVDVNQRFCDMLGYARAELIGKAVSTLNHPDEGGKGAALRNQVMRGEIKSAIGEKRFVCKDGAVIWARRSMSIARNYAGEPQYVISVVEDITERKQAEKSLQESESRYRSVIAALAEGVILRDKDARIIDCNASAERILGRTLDQMRGNTYFDPEWRAIREDGSPFPNDERPANAALRSGKPQSEATVGLRKPDGVVLWLSMSARPLSGASGPAPSGVVTTITDITERKQAEQYRAMGHAVTRVLTEAETLTEAVRKIIQTICETMEWHCGACWRWDKEAGALRCVECWGIDTPEIQNFIADNKASVMKADATPVQGLVRRIYHSREPLWIADVSQEKGLLRAPFVIKAGLHGAFGFPLLLGGEILGLMEFFHRDVRKPDETLLQNVQSIGNQIGQYMARKQVEERVRHLAHYDELTGLPNRSMFNQRLSHALIQAKRHDRLLAVLFIDLDRFKNINDTLGHEAGDRVLKEVADRLRECLRESDTVGRLGGDEFVVLIEELLQPVHVAVVAQRILAAVAQKILSAVARPFIVDANEFHITASIGISTYPDDSADMQSLLKNADISMYRAKEQGKNNFQFYSAQMNVHTLERLALESNLRRALERSEFLLHYQPKVDIASGRIIGMEALVRWQQSGKLMPPAQFIPLAEETGLIVPIGAWVMKTACMRNKSWQEQGLPPLRVAVNLSARQFTHATLLQDVARALNESGLDPTALELEITESMVMHNPEYAVELLTKLKGMGIHLSIDDFGTGYSSLNYLKRFPLDSVKIDRSFIKDLPGDSDDAAITQAIIAMAHSLRLKVIAEGVETEQQLSFLRAHGCDEMQGYYFSKPLPETEFFELLQHGADARVTL